MTVVYLGLGSNLGDRRENLRKALALLDGYPDVTVETVSDLYETPPVGGPGQPWFINAAVGIATEFSPKGLLGVCRDIESRLGRVRGERWGPRTIDCDILLYGRETVATKELTIPHPLMHERAFVLVPLAGIAPGVVHPETGMTVSELLAGVDTSGIRPLGPLEE